MLRIYLDTNVWGRPFDDPTSKRIREEAEAFFIILEGAYYQQKHVIITSLILDDEIAQIEGGEKRGAVEALVDIFTAEKIGKFSKSLQMEIKTHGLKDKDAMHFAFAVGNSDYFITCDDEILDRGEGIEESYKIKVVNPVEFIREAL